MKSSRTDLAPCPDALDELEGSVFEKLASDIVEIGEAERAAIRTPSKLYADNPPIDPSEGRQSTAELLALLRALDGQVKPTAPEGRTRAGYVLATQSVRSGEPGVAPAFVAALGLDDLRNHFSDLWAIDAAVWDALDTPEDVKKLARLWLESPGRRIIQDIGILERMPHGGRCGATDFSAARLDDAIGLQHLGTTDVPSALRAHHELHAAVPGQAYGVWEPKPEDGNLQVIRALGLLEEGSPLGLRGAALAWLLDRAADEPFYEVDKVRRDLREDLSMRLGTALRSWLDPSPTNDVSRQLEALTLQHAARFFEGDTSAHAARRGWAIARWLQGCLRRSPYFGGDEEVLAAHLRARLPATPVRPPADADVLHPGRFAVDGEGLDVAEVAFVSAVLAHYTRVGERTLLPAPVPLLHALQRIAGRPVRTAEEEADGALGEHNALGWSAAYSIIAPVAVRRLLTELRIGWLARVDQDAQLDSIKRFAVNPKRHEWLAFAINREGQHLMPTALACAVDAFRDLVRRRDGDAHVVATFGAGILQGLDDADAEHLRALASRSDMTWRPFVLDAVAGAGFRLNNVQVFLQAMERLFEVMGDVAQTDKARLNAAYFAVQRMLPPKVPDRDRLQKRVAEMIAERSFPEHTDLRAAIRRFGVTTSNAGSKR